MDLIKIDDRYSIAAEAAVIGSILIDRDNGSDVCWHRIFARLKPEDFYIESNRVIYGVLLALYEANKPPDVILLRDSLEASGSLDDIGGVGYIAELADSVPSTANVDYYAGVIEEKRLHRRAIVFIAESEDIIKGHESPSGAIEKIQELPTP